MAVVKEFLRKGAGKEEIYGPADDDNDDDDDDDDDDNDGCSDCFLELAKTAGRTNKRK